MKNTVYCFEMWYYFLLRIKNKCFKYKTSKAKLKMWLKFGKNKQGNKSDKRKINKKPRTHAHILLGSKNKAHFSFKFRGYYEIAKYMFFVSWEYCLWRLFVLCGCKCVCKYTKLSIPSLNVSDIVEQKIFIKFYLRNEYFSKWWWGYVIKKCLQMVERLQTRSRTNSRNSR